MKDLFSKVIIVSNTLGTGKFSDFVNFAPRTGIPLEYVADQLQLITGDSATEAKNKIKMNLSFVAPSPESKLAETNAYDVSQAHKLGIHCVAMDIWTAGAGKQLSEVQTMFKTYSFSLKPADLRYKVHHLAPALAAPNPNWGNAAEGQAGVFRAPPAIQFPGT